MNKVKTLESILNAKKAHLAQMQKIEMAMEGGSVKDPTSLTKTECSFGQWLYDENNNLRKILGPLFYDKLEAYHSAWHNEYASIFEILFKKEEKQGFFSKLTGGSKLNDMELDKAKLYYSELETTTKELIQVVDASHRRLMALQDFKFE